MTHEILSLESNCSWARDQLGRFLDGELSDSSARRLTQHLEVCARCRESLEEETEVLATTVEHSVAGEPSDGLSMRIAAALPGAAARPASATGSTATVHRLPSWLSAAAVVLLVLGLLMIHDSSPNSTGPDAGSEGRNPKLAMSETLPAMPDAASAVEPESPVVVASESDEVIISGTRVPGDLDGDGSYGFADVLLFAGYLGGDKGALPCEAAADFDDDSVLTPGDLVAFASGQFLSDDAYANASAELFQRDSDSLPCDESVCLN